MALQRPGTILDKDEDLPDSGVDAVTQGKVNKPIFTREGYGGLRTYFGQRLQSFPGSPGQDDG
jgi:hypothetical protein